MEAVSTDNWSIEALVCGDGSVGESGIVLEKGKLYCSAALRGGHESFHAIDTVSIDRSCDRALSFETRSLSSSRKFYPKACVVPNFRLTRLHLAGRARARVIEETVTNFAKRNEGIVVSLGGPGAREKDTRLTPFMIHDEFGPLVTSGELDCVPASLVNALGCWGGVKLAEKVRDKLKNDPTHFIKIGRIANTMHRMRLGCELQKPAKHIRKDLHAGRYNRAFEWLAEFCTGVWLVRLVEDNIVDHCVAIDANNGIILDSEECHPLRLTQASLQFCAGPKSKKIRVAEIFQIVKSK